AQRGALPHGGVSRSCSGTDRGRTAGASPVGGRPRPNRAGWSGMSTDATRMILLEADHRRVALGLRRFGSLPNEARRVPGSWEVFGLSGKTPKLDRGRLANLVDVRGVEENLDHGVRPSPIRMAAQER